MTTKMLFDTLKKEFGKIIREHQLSASEIVIHSKALSAQEAIGITERKDFPIITGKETMLEAHFRGAAGQSFTDAPAAFQGKLEDILSMDIEEDPHARGLFIASMNAVMRYLGLIEKTIHCKNEEPELCAKELTACIREKYGSPKITLVGYQPAMLESLAKAFPLRVLDLDVQNINQVRYGVRVEDGVDAYEDAVLNWPDLVLCTGSTLCNGSIVNFLEIGKEVLFFGTTISGAAYILGLPRVCFYSA